MRACGILAVLRTALRDARTAPHCRGCARCSRARWPRRRGRPPREASAAPRCRGTLTVNARAEAAGFPREVSAARMPMSGALPASPNALLKSAAGNARAEAERDGEGGPFQRGGPSSRGRTPFLERPLPEREEAFPREASRGRASTPLHERCPRRRSAAARHAHARRCAALTERGFVKKCPRRRGAAARHAHGGRRPAQPSRRWRGAHRRTCTRRTGGEGLLPSARQQPAARLPQPRLMHAS